MSEHINNPIFSYYENINKEIGGKGDFVTSPEISQIFGELIGLWCANVWLQLGSPKQFNLVELGPGNGTLIKDALRALKIVPEFLRNVEIHLVETSDYLKKIQVNNLNDYDIFWHKDFSTVPKKTNIIISNEFLDTFPIHQYELKDSFWAERYIGLNSEDNFCFINQKINKSFLSELNFLPNGSIIEFSPSINSFIEKISNILKMQGGCALFIDYGYEKPIYRSTLRSISNHKFVDIFKDIGNTDLSALVNFGDLTNLADKLGIYRYGPTSQSSFLQKIGIHQRAEKLVKHNPKKAKEIYEDINKLTNAKEMGQVFKVFAISHELYDSLPGF